ncbi:hypothetical protein CR969_00680 [Candidatus Saccharibacteria bacterium]|nr:MAG: hypothetical protein CR969_00680 [Candidatus Saccharibacteria bacterium]
MTKLPKLVTFDGEARSGKGTVVQLTKDYLRDERGHKVMLIDAGQVFRVLVVAIERAGVDIDDPAAIDAYLADQQNAKQCVQLVKDVYHMEKAQRDALLYTNQVGANSAKVGARPGSQSFKDDLLHKWLKDAAKEGYNVVLLDGRALEETGGMLESEGLCDFRLGLYFICDPQMGARRTLGFSGVDYQDLNGEDKQSVDELVEQIIERNRKDSQRLVQPIVPPKNAKICRLPSVELPEKQAVRPMLICDTSTQMTKLEMSRPVAELVADLLV